MRKLSRPLIFLAIFWAVLAGHHAQNPAIDEIRTVAETALLARDWHNAEQAYRTLLDWEDTGTGADHEVATTLSGLATALVLQGEAGEARALFSRVMRVLGQLGDPDPLLMADALHGLARAAALKDETYHALSVLHHERALREPWAQDEPLELARTLRELGRVDDGGDDLGIGGGWSGVELSLYEQAFEQGQLEIPPFLDQVSLDSEREIPRLRFFFLRTIALVQDAWPNDAALGDALRGIARAYRDDGWEDEALEWHERAWNARPPASFAQALEAYQAFPDHKAIALAMDADGHWAYGFTVGARDDERAAKAALCHCRVRLPRYKVGADCRIYAVNDGVVWEPVTFSDPGDLEAVQSPAQGNKTCLREPSLVAPNPRSAPWGSISVSK